jgi:hypothetical protein
MRFKLFILGLVAVIVMVISMPAVANDGKIPPIIDPSLDDHPWGGDQIHPGGDGGPLQGGSYPVIGNCSFFSRLALSMTWTTVTQTLLTSATGTSTSSTAAPAGTSVRRPVTKPTTSEARNR